VSVVLVHGAGPTIELAKIIAPLAADGVPGDAAPLPLTSFRATWRRSIERSSA